MPPPLLNESIINQNQYGATNRNIIVYQCPNFCDLSHCGCEVNGPSFGLYTSVAHESFRVSEESCLEKISTAILRCGSNEYLLPFRIK